jgi:hypothetical protein
LIGSGTISASATKDEVKRLLRLATKTGRPDKYAGKRRKSRFRADLWMELNLDPKNPNPIQVTTHDFSTEGVSFWVRCR